MGGGGGRGGGIQFNDQGLWFLEFLSHSRAEKA